MEHEIIHGSVKLEEVFPHADLSAFDWIESAKCFDVRKDAEKSLYCPFCGRYIQLTLKEGCVLSADELGRLRYVFEKQIGFKIDCTGSPEKCVSPYLVYRVVYEMPLSLYDTMQKEIITLKSGNEKVSR